MFDRRLDYLDLQIHRKRVGEIRIKGMDEEGIECETRILTHDGLGFELFQHLGIFPATMTRKFSSEYASPERDIFWEAYETNASLQLKGAFFIRPDYKELLQKIVLFLKERNITFNVSRVDLAFTFPFAGDFFKELMKGDYKNLLVKPRIQKKQWHYLICENSRFEMAGYCKTKQLQKLKNEVYNERFLKSLGLNQLPEENLYRIDLRLRQKETNTQITEALYNGVINFEAIEAEIISQAAKRMRFSKKMRVALKLK